MEHKASQLGPVLDEDAQFLQAIIKMTNPKTIVEFGYFWGASSNAMLEVMDDDAVIHCYDNTKDPNSTDPRLKFHKVSQDEPIDVENIDFVFLDASHFLKLNKATFLNIRERLSEKAIIAVHDTGTWVGGNVFGAGQGHLNEKGEWVHCPEEIEFVNWLRGEFPDYQQIHFHSSRKVRHGITLLQKYVKL